MSASERGWRVRDRLRVRVHRPGKDIRCRDEEAAVGKNGAVCSRSGGSGRTREERASAYIIYIIAYGFSHLFGEYSAAVSANGHAGAAGSSHRRCRAFSRTAIGGEQATLYASAAARQVAVFFFHLFLPLLNLPLLSAPLSFLFSTFFPSTSRLQSFRVSFQRIVEHGITTRCVSLPHRAARYRT